MRVMRAVAATMALCSAGCGGVLHRDPAPPPGRFADALTHCQVPYGRWVDVSADGRTLRWSGASWDRDTEQHVN